jgi:hypothetical protein
MAIVATEIESIHGAVGQQRLIFYRCQDSDGVWHKFGPLICNDASFDAEAYKTTVEENLAAQLAEQELDEVLG